MTPLIEDVEVLMKEDEDEGEWRTAIEMRKDCQKRSWFRQ